MMNTATALTLICIGWALCGPPAIMLDWTRKFDMTIGDAVFCTLVGAGLGPFAWGVWWMDGKSFGAGRVLWKRHAPAQTRR